MQTGTTEHNSLDIRCSLLSGKFHNCIEPTYPLHYALSQKFPISVLRSLLVKAPNSIYETDSDGCTPLFLAVSSNEPLPTIRMLLSAYPSAASVANYMGELPLHVTRSIETAALLIQVYPEGIQKPTKAKWLPLHTARSTPLAQFMIQEGIRRHIRYHKPITNFVGGMYQKDASGQNPVERLGSSISWCLSCSDGSGDNAISSTRVPLNPIISILWNQLYILTRATAKFYTYTREDVDLTSRSSSLGEQRFLMLHSLIELGPCWRDLLEVALDLYPQQICERDVFGRTPLAIALAGGLNKKSCDNKEMAPSEVVHLLLERSQKAARIPDYYGRLPLHILADNGGNIFGNGGLNDIILAEPRALAAKDPKTGMYPFMIAATRNSSYDCYCGEGPCCCDLDTIYFLLRECPSVIRVMLA